MPSFVFSVSSLPRSFGGLLFGVLKIFNANVPPVPVVPVVPEYSTPLPTKTTPIYLPPTRCSPGPSSSPSEFPDTALLGLIAMVIIGLVCIVCTMFNASPPDTRPPLPPPPKPKKLRPTSSSSSRDPWSRVIWAYLAIIVFGTPIAHHLYFDKPRLVGDLGTQIMLMAEKVFLAAWDSVESLFSLKIVPHWRQYCKIGFHAFTSHSMGLLVFFTYRRLYTPAVVMLQAWGYLVIAGLCVPVAVLGSISKLRWILWTIYCYYDVALPRVSAIHHAILLPFRVSYPLGTNIWMTLGPVGIHTVLLNLLTAILAVRAVPWTIRAAYRLRPELYLVIRDLGILTSFVGVIFPLGLSLFEYCNWPAEIRTLCWRSVIDAEARERVRSEINIIWDRNLHWKIGRMEEFHSHGWELRYEVWEALGTWGSMHVAQKVLIVAPIAILYGHYYVMPEIRRQWYGWRFRRRRRCNPLPLLPLMSDLDADLYGDLYGNDDPDFAEQSHDDGASASPVTEAAAKPAAKPAPAPVPTAAPVTTTQKLPPISNNPQPIASYTTVTQQIPTYEQPQPSEYRGGSVDYQNAGERSVRPSEMKDEG
ncbi:hypothetical protein FB45DRAFT_1033684 [Roridomyces roridus]|uniref:Uncharacterized protein n=1 Tax=Roridomyces roridus TaxID=1738132 RepID=A0AAD7BEL6_9AGAR|nr:hypothetical protein FB45DRAFT_1033684 [Roridomyces roridus]